MTFRTTSKIIFLSVFCLWQIPSFGQHSHNSPRRDTGGKTFRSIDRDVELGKLAPEEGLLNKFYYAFEPEKLNAKYKNDQEFVRCFTPVLIEYSKEKNQLSRSADLQIARYLSKSSEVTNIHVSPSKRFKLTYTTSGDDSVSVIDSSESGVPDYIEKAALYADSSWAYQVAKLGFPDFVKEDAPYVINFKNLGDHLYGYTETDQETTYIVVHSTFEEFPSNDDPEGNTLGALKATIAHEMKHAIQYATNRFRGDAGTLNWIEMDATMMEEIVFPQVNDYHNYLPTKTSIFRAPEEGIPGAYYHVTWSLYFAERFNMQFWVDVWEKIGNDHHKPMMNAVSETLDDMDESLPSEFIRNYIWHYASSSRWVQNYGFAEGNRYPDVYLTSTSNGIPDTMSRKDTINHQAASLHEIIPTKETGPVVVEWNYDIPETGIGLLAFLKDGSIEELIPPFGDLKSGHVETGWEWGELESLGIALVNFSPDTTSEMQFLASSGPMPVSIPEDERPIAVMLEQNYPNPFNLSTNISFSLPDDQHVSLTIYDITGRKVTRLVDTEYPSGTHTIAFNSSNLSSGMYVYRLRTQGSVKTKKMLLVK